jgi:hypothetical protein
MGIALPQAIGVLMTDDEKPIIPAGETPSETPDENPDTPPVIDATAYEAKIASLVASSADKDSLIAQLNAQIIAQKAANYDLLTQVRGDQPLEQDTELDIPDDDTPDIDDFFAIPEKP